MRESDFVFDESLEQGAIIKIIGVGERGVRAVEKMAGRVHGVECLGLNLYTGHHHETNALPMLYIAEPQKEQSFDLMPLIKAVESSDLVFLVTYSEDVLNYLPADISRAIKQMGIPLVVVEPEIHHDDSHSIEIVAQNKELQAIADALIFVSNASLRPLDPEAPKVFDEAGLMEYLIRHSIEKITDLITYQSFMCIDLADVFSIFKNGGMARLGIGMSSGTSKGVSATAEAFSALEQQGVSVASAELRVLCCINGSSNMTMDDYNDFNQYLHNSIHENSNIKIGVLVRDELGDNLMVTIWVVGV